MRTKYIRIAAIISAFLLISAIAAAALVYHGIILLNNPSNAKYPVRGVDVSSYQGDIDWQLLSSQNIDFAFIKATEGSTFVDPCFTYNFSEAQKCGISVGAYHFFSNSSKGLSQAENFIDTVVAFEGMLPPVIDFEVYGDQESDPQSRDAIRHELTDLLSALEEHYGLKPIIYATEKSYELYLSGEYEEYDIWIRNVISKPDLCDDREWRFWQFTNREKLRGYKGEEKFIDANVFNGSKEDFLLYPRFSSGTNLST